jgi:hypothetical protein
MHYQLPIYMNEVPSFPSRTQNNQYTYFWDKLRTREWKDSSIIINLVTEWRWVVSFKFRPLYPRSPFYRRRSGRCGEEKNVVLCLGVEPRLLRSFSPLDSPAYWAVPVPKFKWKVGFEVNQGDDYEDLRLSGLQCRILLIEPDVSGTCLCTDSKIELPASAGFLLDLIIAEVGGDILTCRGCCVTYKTSFGFDDRIYWRLIYSQLGTLSLIYTLYSSPLHTH